MNPSPSFSPAAEEQAALWAARLDGSTLTAADRQALDSWLAENPAHRALLSSYCQFSADLEQQLPALVETGKVTMPSVQPKARRSTAWFASLAVAAAAVVVLGVWFTQFGHRAQTIATSAAHRQSVTLADGTRVELNARTQLIVENGRGERRVRLTEGEAFFMVSKDKTRPFIVETPSGSVRVTGTTFDVRCETAAALDVVVVEGSVQVSAGLTNAAPVALGAGDHLSAVDHEVSVHNLSSAAVAEMLAWRQGLVVFHEVSIAEALARFARYHGNEITASPAAIAANHHIGGVFSLDDLDTFFSALEKTQRTQPFQVVHDAHGAVLVKLRTEP